jgi:hypothetical protein
MVRIIETNLSIHNEKGEVMDHQSRIIEAESWDKYIDYYFNHMNGFKEQKEFKCLDNMTGRTLQSRMEIVNFKYDEIHLTCDVIQKYEHNGSLHTMKTKKLAYLVIE